MKDTRVSMGMPIVLEIVDTTAAQSDLDAAFVYFDQIDARFSTYKPDSEIVRINRKEITPQSSSPQMREVFALAEKTKRETQGYFDITQPDGTIDPSGVVKGWAIRNVAEVLQKKGFENFYINAGGDIASWGKNSEGGEWSVGIKNPFNPQEIIKVLYPRGHGVATSGSYERGQHIYNPQMPEMPLTDVVSVTVVGGDVCEADLYATAAFAMGREGVEFIEKLPGFEAYAIDKDGIAIMTSGFEYYTTL